MIQQREARTVGTDRPTTTTEIRALLAQIRAGRRP